MTAQSLAGVTIAAPVVHVVVRLKQAVLLDDPADLGANVRPDNGGGELCVVIRRELVSEVMNERREHQLVVRAVLAGPRRTLQAVSKAAHGIALQGVIELAQRLE